MPRHQYAHLNANYHEVTLMVKMLTINVTYHTPQSRVNATNTHVTLNTITNVLQVHHVRRSVSLAIQNHAMQITSYCRLRLFTFKGCT